MENLFSALLSFREKNPEIKGCGIYCNDPILEPITETLRTLKEKIKKEFQIYKGFTFNITMSSGQTYFPSILHICILPPIKKYLMEYMQVSVLIKKEEE